MSDITEYVYQPNDNTIDLILKEDGVAYSLASVTKIEVAIAGTVISSTNQASDPIRWNQVGYATGELRMSLGSQDITSSIRAWITIYDASHTNGIRWDWIKLKVYPPVTEETE